LAGSDTVTAANLRFLLDGKSALINPYFYSMQIFKKLVKKALPRATAAGQARSHHPDPFDPKITKGWKAAVKVRKLS
jgi:hypothetical protein